ncbi:MAG TPA: ribonuclease H-like domain-containing protein [bacterium]|nr:ribonuclease H-like domain-containing protein [bacterium]
MLKNSFIHIPGIGALTERRIWSKGILTWEEFLKNPGKTGFPLQKYDNVRACIDLSAGHLQKGDIGYFYESLPRSESWRLYPEFRDRAVFLDIETTGLSPCYDAITVIGLFDGRESRAYVAGRNMRDFMKDIVNYSLVITYNGSLFDLPFIKAGFPMFEIPAQIDLRFFLRSLGYSGGLKSIERQFGITRNENIRDMDGFEAVMLWNRYRRGDENALKLLLEYNAADIKSLKTLMETGYRMMRGRLFPNLLDSA